MTKELQKDAPEVSTEQKSPQHIQAEQLKAWLNDPQTKQTLAEQARMFETNVGRNWFYMSRVIKKTQYRTYETAKTILDVLCMAGLAHARFENSQHSWKITIDKATKVLALKADVGAIDAQILLLQEKKAAILKSIELQEPQTSVQE